MKKSKYLTCAMSLALLITGCSLYGNNISEEGTSSVTVQGKDSEKPAEENAQPPKETAPKAIDSPEVTAYKDFLTENYNDEELSVALVHLDEDDVYELALIHEKETDPKIYLYGYQEGEVVSLEIEGFPFYGDSGDFFYLDKANCFFYSYYSSNDEETVTTEFVFSMKEGKPALDHTLCAKTRYDSDETTYYIDDKEVTNQEFDDFNDENSLSEYDPISVTCVIDEYCAKLSGMGDADELEEALSRDYRVVYFSRETEIMEPALKPAIYLYPEQDNSSINVSLDIDGYYTELIPEFNTNNGWNVTADRNGDIRLDGTTYDYLFWEAMLKTEYTFDEGFCVKGEDTREFLESTLTTCGLNAKEKEQFIEYWLPKMENNAYNVISFQKAAYTDHAGLKVNPAPDTTIRVFMAFYASDEYVDIKKQTIITPTRSGFTLVEWGGSEIK